METWQKHFWATFTKPTSGYARMNIIFDLYITYSIKETERKRRNTVEGINTNISGSEQQLPIDIKKFWTVNENKMKFQQFFIYWLRNTYYERIPLYLGGSHRGEINSCFKLSDGIFTEDRLLKCDHEEAYDRIMFHVNHAVKVDKFSKVVIASSDTDVFVCALYHFSRWIYSGLNELWIISGKSGSINFTPVHKIVNVMDSNVIDVLPAVPALTGCDTTSKVRTKYFAFQAAMKCGYDLLYSFGKSEISDQMIFSAEKFLVDSISKNSNSDNFDDFVSKHTIKSPFN